MTKSLSFTSALVFSVPLLMTAGQAHAQNGLSEGTASSLESSSSLATTPPATSRPEPRHSFDISPVSPFIGIWVAQYAYAVTPKNELMTGISYMNLPYDTGSTHAVSVFLGYRRYLWKGLHLEYQIWPMVDWFYEKHEGRYYRSFDLWGTDGIKSGKAYDLVKFNRDCWGPSTSTAYLAQADLEKLDMIGIQVASSDTTEITLSDLCLEKVEFGK